MLLVVVGVVLVDLLVGMVLVLGVAVLAVVAPNRPPCRCADPNITKS